MNPAVDTWVQMYIHYKDVKNQLEQKRDEIVNFMKQQNATTLVHIDANNQQRKIVLQTIKNIYIDPRKLSQDAYDKSASMRVHERLTLLTVE